MRVNISYAVHLDEVPRETEKLLGECEDTLRKLHGEMDALAGQDPLRMIESIHTIRAALGSLDMRLGDCSRILSGYVEIRNKSNSGEVDPEFDLPEESGE